jgi:hypothetical protein
MVNARTCWFGLFWATAVGLTWSMGLAWTAPPGSFPWIPAFVGGFWLLACVVTTLLDEHGEKRKQP